MPGARQAAARQAAAPPAGDAAGSGQTTRPAAGRALADGEWQALVAALAPAAADDERLVCLVDTGGIVVDGAHTDQFAMVRSLLAPVGSLPSLVDSGHHELQDDEVTAARANTAAFLR